MSEDNPREGRNEQQAEVDDVITEITSGEIEMALRNMKNVNVTGPDHCRSVEEFGKNWSKLSEGSIEQDH